MKKAIGKFDYAYNSTHGITADLFESLLQKADESSVVFSIWNGFKVLIGRFIPYSDKIIKILQEWSNNVENTDLIIQIAAYKSRHDSVTIC
ncbi:MAG: hypothetical protein L3I99_04520 [Sulfurimonas sp.]|nr:hypothetical protein [Sulfurimonas sp.]